MKILWVFTLHYWCNTSFFFFWPCCMAWRILVPQPGIKHSFSAVETWSLNTGPPEKSLMQYILKIPSFLFWATSQKCPCGLLFPGGLALRADIALLLLALSLVVCVHFRIFASVKWSFVTSCLLCIQFAEGLKTEQINLPELMQIKVRLAVRTRIDCVLEFCDIYLGKEAMRLFRDEKHIKDNINEPQVCGEVTFWFFIMFWVVRMRLLAWQLCSRW